jgi:anti-sigma regulatory factor (Ser/Thr protein kinase)
VSTITCFPAVDANPLVIRTDLAVPLGLSVNELVTNSLQHSRPRAEAGACRLLLKTAPDSFSISVSDEGNGPPLHADTQTSGIGARMIEAFARQIEATITKGRNSAGYGVRVTVPRRADRASIERRRCQSLLACNGSRILDVRDRTCRIIPITTLRTRLSNGVACPAGDCRLNKKNQETVWNRNIQGERP